MPQVGAAGSAPQPLGEKALNLLARIRAVHTSVKVIEDRLHGNDLEPSTAAPIPLTLHDVIDAAHGVLNEIEAYLNKIHQSIGDALSIPDGPTKPAPASRLR